MSSQDSSDISAPTLSFIIVTYNGRQMVSECLKSVFHQSTKPLEVILVDNNSSDGTASLVESRFPEVKVIKNSQNRGYGTACNQGATEATGEVLGVLNQDTILDAEWSTEMCRVLQDRPRCGAVEGRLLLSGRRNILNCAGSYLNLLGFGVASGFGMLAEGGTYPKLVSYPSGAAFAIRSQVFRQVGGFDETYFLYHDDVDLGLRVHRAGWEIAHIPTAVAYHDFQSGLAPEKIRFLEENRWKTLVKNMPLSYFIRCAPLFLLSEFGLALYLGSVGLLRPKLRAMVGFLRRIRSVLAARRVLKGKLAGLATPEAVMTDAFPGLMPTEDRLTSFARGVQSAYLRAFFLNKTLENTGATWA